MSDDVNIPVEQALVEPTPAPPPPVVEELPVTAEALLSAGPVDLPATEPVAEEPLAAEPAAVEPEPLAEVESAEEEPDVGDLFADEPLAEEPLVKEPEAEEPVAEEEAPPPEPENKRHWYVVKVQSGREDTIKEAIERRMRKEGLEEYVGQIVIPVEKYQEIKQDKNGKRVTKTKERKLYPGYLMVEVEYNDRILYLFRETSGVGDFVGAHPGDLTRAPTPMSDVEVKRMLGPTLGKDGGKEEPISPIPKWLHEGDRVRVVDGTFNGMEGMVKHILESVSKVQVELTIFGRPVAVDLEFYQVEQL